jgi:hypothetical protein
MIPHLFDCIVATKRILREGVILSQLVHANVTYLLDRCVESDYSKFNILYVVSDKMAAM